MGADFIHAAIPCCEFTDERKAEIDRLVRSLPNEEFHEWRNFPRHEGDDIDQLGYFGRWFAEEVLPSLWDIPEMSDVGVWNDSSAEVKSYWLTGGLSYGDAPTESYRVIQAVIYVNELNNLLHRYAKDDHARRQDHTVRDIERPIRRLRVD
jgi:hypothetical protein